MKRILSLLLLILPFYIFGQLKFETIRIKDALIKAKKENKGVLIDVTSGRIDDANISKVLSEKALSDKLLQNFIPIRIDMLNVDNQIDYAEYITNLSYPVMVFLNANGSILGNGYWDEMAVGRQQFSQVLDKAIQENLVKKTNTRSIKFMNMDYNEALKLSKQTGKPIFIDSYFIGCGPCKRMEEDVFTLDRVADFYNNNFICLKLDRANDPYKLIEKFKVFGFPGLLYINSDGSLNTLHQGYRDADQFISLGQKALDSKGEAATAGLSETPSNMVTGTSSSSTAGSTATVAMSGSTSSVPATASTASLGSSSSSAAATSGSSDGSAVQFEKLSLSDAVQKAKAMNKSIYVDMSATWCQPCKMMKKDVFPDPAVVEYLNKHFISIYFECDIDSALSNAYRDKYITTAFPTHLLIDKNGELIHKFVGYMKVSSFLEELNKGVLATTGLGSFHTRYKNGERSPAFMNEYITMLANANEGERASGLASEYLATLSLNELADRKTFFLINEFVRDLDSDLTKKIFANKQLFEKNAGQSAFDQYVGKVWLIKGLSYVKEDAGVKKLDKDGYDQFLKRLSESGIAQIEYVKTTSMMENLYLTADWNSYVNFAIDYMQKEKGNASPMLTWNWGARLQSECPDKNLKTKYLQALELNYDLIKKSGSDQAIVWAESMKVLMNDLKK
ncbi:thioredoxin family protein [Sphingobacterium yanglingense]|uniref:Uncharacterized protein DUF255 n=1 Tax=Sphingobacterium yanglingense TaxID=1437280 RepID=A0A4R6WIY7_9SPHI|nr:thioredoxin family protein [Sphingobacterium yanglingense]TDQ77924.1 uncharacterized protein DUF255 [Sphingobacterium yanglingense]